MKAAEFAPSFWMGISNVLSFNCIYGVSEDHSPEPTMSISSKPFPICSDFI